MSIWADRSLEVIRRVVAEVGTDDKQALRKALFEAYPFGQRKYWPYKVWLQEVRKVLKTKPAPQEIPEKQLTLFDLEMSNER
jgi:hypothetical protein